MHWVQRSFSVNPAALAPGHPYPVYPTSTSSTIQFYEFRGIGPPAANFGHAGDVYIDLNPRLHALYWRDRDLVRGGDGPWKRWIALLLDQVPLHTFLISHPWAQHPEQSDLYLWADPNGVGWRSKDAVCASRVRMIQLNVATVVPGTVPDVEALVSQVLRKMVETEQNANAAGQQSSTSSHGHRSFTPNPVRNPMFSSSSSSMPFRPPSSAGYTTSSSPTHSATSPRSQTSRAVFSDHPAGGYVGPRPPARETRYLTREQPDHTAEIALDGMRRAQNAELRSKQELKHKNRELARLRQKEKDVISMSYHYQKRERELVAARAATEQRSSTELEEMRAAVQTLQRQAEVARQQTQAAVSQVHQSQEELAAIQREIASMRRGPELFL